MSAEEANSQPHYYVSRPVREPREPDIDFSPIGGIVPVAILAGIVYLGYTYRDKILEIIKNLDKNIQSGIKNFPAITLPSIPSSSSSPSSSAPPTSTISGGQTDSNGIKIPFKLTGKSVKMNVGARHPNGDRYNANHKFQNYYVVGYYTTQGGSGKRLIEMKTDGPNHSGCTSGPDCEWVELDFDISNGQAYISSEYPHPQNHPAVTQGVTATKLNGTFTGKSIGFGVAAYDSPDGFRIYEEWIDPGGPGANQWVRTLHAKNTGQIIPNPKRKLPFGRSNSSGSGLEAEIRMNNQHGTSMKFGNIYEIVPPSSANLALSYPVYDQMRPLFNPRISTS